MPSSSRTRKSGPVLVILLYGGLILLTLGTTWISLNHPKTEAFHQGDLMPLAKCVGIHSGNVLEVMYKGEQESLQLRGVNFPLQRPERLPAERDPEQEDGIACGVLQGWIYKKQLVLVFDGDDPLRNENNQLVAYAELYGVDVGKKLIEEGQATASEAPHPRRDLYLALEQAVKERKKGIWR